MTNPYDSPAGPARAVPRTAGQRKLSGKIIGGIFLGILANAMVVVACLPILFMKPGSLIKPLFGDPLPCFAMLLGLGALGLSAIGMAKSSAGYRWLGLLGIVIACTPWPLSSFLLHWFASLNGVILEN